MAQNNPVGGPQAEIPLAGTDRLQQAGRFGTEGGGGRVGYLGADLVRESRGADGGHDVGRVRAQRLHGGHGGRGGAGHRAPPARVRAGQHVGRRVVEHDRHAVGGQYGQHRAGVRGDQYVGAGDGVGRDGRAPAAVGRPDDLGHVAVYLGREHEIGRVRVQRGGGPAAVLQHVGRVVADLQAEVQRAVATGGNATRAGGGEGVEAEGVKDRPGEHVEPAYLAEHGRSGRGHDHRERS